VRAASSQDQDVGDVSKSLILAPEPTESQSTRPVRKVIWRLE